MTRLRWGVRTMPQHTTYDALRAVGRDADRTSAFARVALRPFRADPGRPGWSLLGGVDAAVTPGGPDIAPAPRIEGRYYQFTQARCEPKPNARPTPDGEIIAGGDKPA